MFTQSTIETRFDREDGKNRGMGQAKIGLLGLCHVKNFAAGWWALRRKRRSQKIVLDFVLWVLHNRAIILGRLLRATSPGCLAEDEEFGYAIFIVAFESNHSPPMAKPRSWRIQPHFPIAEATFSPHKQLHRIIFNKHSCRIICH